MSKLNITGICPWCNGTGTTTTPQGIDGNLVTEPCSHCESTGYLETISRLDITEVMDLLDWIKKKIKKILVKLELPEE